ncbi:unnamed protein product [Adineta steineri]|uniref:NHL repeat containing protein-like protein n=1 Tax=Adineta steineri TaxID=433720 RepID=A0A815PQL7_9BILA|nr:unnamed protein product [Adineta steineri]CAF1452189.1 unnamed protein product [Adineta steineri]
MFFQCSSALWYNQPKFSPCATWNSYATTFANSTTLGPYTHGIFIDTNNTIYAGSWGISTIKVWRYNSSTPIRTITAGLYGPYSVFVAMNGDIYIDNGLQNGRVDKWTPNAINSVEVMNISKACFNLFIDTNNTLYCSVADLNIVVTLNLNTNSKIPVTLIGSNGTAGSTSTLLNYPWGIYVKTDFTLYVADSNNNRIQSFKFGELNGTTVAGSTAPGTITLQGPGGIVLDNDGYMFIMDTANSRIIASSSNGFRCVAGCSGLSGSTPDKLYNPRYMAFDTYGNMFVSDDDNYRIQIFTLTSNTCNQTTVGSSSTSLSTTTQGKTTVGSSSTSMSTSTQGKTTASTVSNRMNSSVSYQTTSTVTHSIMASGSKSLANTTLSNVLNSISNSES